MMLYRRILYLICEELAKKYGAVGYILTGWPVTQNNHIYFIEGDNPIITYDIDVIAGAEFYIENVIDLENY